MTLAMTPLLLPSWFDPAVLIGLLGNWWLWGVAFIIFAECGLFSILPGDSLLFTVGMFTATGTITYGSPPATLGIVFVVLTIAAVLGNVVGYWIGYRVGPVVFDRPNSRLFRPEYVERSQRFYARFGVWTIIIGRFVPIVRTVATVMAGVGRMRFSVYALCTLIGGVIWSDGVLLLGHQLGKIKFVQDNKDYIDYAVVGVVLLSLVPAAVHFVQGRRAGPRKLTD